jgi:NADH pyrophosphatase NudC (nudix superfamily)
MVDGIVRCPYCVFDNKLRVMIRHVDGRYVCNKCGHIARPSENQFKCNCEKCRELRLPVPA